MVARSVQGERIPGQVDGLATSQCQAEGSEKYEKRAGHGGVLSVAVATVADVCNVPKSGLFDQFVNTLT